MVLITISRNIGVIILFGHWQTHSEYQRLLIQNVLLFYQSEKPRVTRLAKALSKLYILDLDSLKPILQPYYSNTGAPAKHQQEIFRSFVLMSELKQHGISDWVDKLKSDALLCSMIGVSPDDVPEVVNHYNFIDRFWLGENPNTGDSLHPFKRKPRKKLGKNQKQPPRHPGIIQKFVDLALQGKTFEQRPERLLQQIFAKVAVEPSAKAGLLGDTQKLVISGDGTCINTGGSPYGIRVCNCKSKGIFSCDCHRRFSDPDARHGWDSYQEVWFYGHCGYFLSIYNPLLKSDLPLYLRLVEAQRHDGVTAIVALAEARKLYPNFKFGRFIGDGAHDNYPTYELLNAWDTKAVIPLNSKSKGHFKFSPPVNVNEFGVPICLEDQPMINDGFMKDRCRIKWRCPLALGKIKYCSHKDQCSPSPYGRTVYTKPEWDQRLFTAIPRGSKEWMTEMKKRTSSERVNKRILEDYKLEASHTRGKKRFSWWVMIHSINIHYDARIKVSKFRFLTILDDLISKVA